MSNFIIKDKTRMGKTRSEQEVQLRKEWGPTMTDAQLDKLKYIEKRNKEKYGLDRGFARMQEVDSVR